MINGHMKAFTIFNNGFLTINDGESITSFLGNFEEAKSDLTNLGNNTFTDDIVMAKVLN
jgi:hypothetical protein